MEHRSYFVFHDNNELIGKSFADSGVPGVDGNNVPQNGVLEYEYNNTDYICLCGWDYTAYLYIYNSQNYATWQA